MIASMAIKGRKTTNVVNDGPPDMPCAAAFSVPSPTLLRCNGRRTGLCQAVTVDESLRTLDPSAYGAER